MRIPSFIVGLVLLSAVPLIALAADTPPPKVTLAAGALEGTHPAGAAGAAFLGIPFAQPPVGALRWHEPLPVARWQGVKAAAKLSPACMQMSREGASGSEDCLYLNVWTPQWPMRGARPVMLWLFGGGNTGNSASNPYYDGAALAKRGVIVVTANYRVGTMGFMAHPALSAESGHASSGNYALHDQLMALRWVQTNIAKFGGDPRQVTLFGQSSGAFDLLSLMTSPLAKGLFHRAIAQSGQILSFGGAMPKARAEQIGSDIATALKAPDGAAALAYLRSLPADQVLKAAAKSMSAGMGSDTGLLTNIDGYVLPENPGRVFAEGRQMAVPLIIGSNSREITPQISADDLRKQITATYGDLAPRALAAYGLADGGAGNTDPLLGAAGAQWMTDTVQRCAAIMEAQWHAAARHPTWHYQFERAVPGREAEGSTHAAEVPFVFGNFERGGPNPPVYTAADRKASAEIQGYWTRFAATGDPNGGANPAWPRAGGGRYLAFTADGPQVKEKLQPAACGVFRDWALRRLEK